MRSDEAVLAAAVGAAGMFVWLKLSALERAIVALASDDDEVVSVTGGDFERVIEVGHDEDDEDDEDTEDRIPIGFSLKAGRVRKRS